MAIIIEVYLDLACSACLASWLQQLLLLRCYVQALHVQQECALLDDIDACLLQFCQEVVGCAVDVQCHNSFSLGC